MPTFFYFQKIDNTSMKQKERREYLIQYLCKEMAIPMRMPIEVEAQKQLLRALLNVRMPNDCDEEFLEVQDAYLQEEIQEKGITDVAQLQPVQKQMFVWKGDITTFRCDAIVNAANSQMLGCFVPNHKCIDNAIHTYAGVQLRQACMKMMEQQGHEEVVGQAKITKGFNLPAKYIIHTVGPYISGEVSEEDEKNLISCYESCLKIADENHLKSIAFCCISTGEFHFPNVLATKLAISTVQKYLKRTNSQLEVIFNVFKGEDEQLYRQYLNTKKSN